MLRMVTRGRRVGGVAFIALLTLIVTVALPAAAQSGPASITLADQPVISGTIVVQRAMIPQDGWIVIYKAGPDGKLLVSPSIGRAALKAGTNRDVVVRLAEEVAEGAPLWAMLHVDEGVIGQYEFPGGPDSPIVIDGVPVLAEITVQAGGLDLTAASDATPVTTSPPDIMPHTAGEEDLLLPLLALALGLIALGGFTTSRAALQPA
ncbi:MAG: hypothetical protein HXY37_04570 [Chloroflexi bacterium]|nr:hypothetical protein [Chloroflexota bacterium]